MQWDLGAQGLAYLGVLSLVCGAGAALLVGDGRSRRLWGAAVTAVACYGVGLLTSEWLFGWATEEDLQPNIDGLSRDEVVVSSLIVTLVVVVVMRVVARPAREAGAHRAARHVVGRHRHA